MIERELNLTSASNNELYVKSWQPKGDAKAVVILVHGFGEHCSRYTPYIDIFGKANIAFVSYDQQGHGKSGGKRGVIFSYKQLLDDVELIIAKAQEMFPNTPKFLYGHSMGGNIALNYILKRQPSISAGIISSPWLKLYKEPATILKGMVSILKNIIPNTTIESGLDTNYISTIKEEVQTYNSDLLNHGLISFRLMHEITKHGSWAIKNTNLLNVPVLLIHGTADQITSPKASAIAAKNNTEKIEHFEFPGMYHEIHNDTAREDLAKKCIAFISKQL